METRAVIAARARRSPPRALYAAGLLGFLVAALLGAWFVSGWHDVRLRQAEVRNAPARAAAARADDIGRELRSELEALLAREVKRPYFHYQNLMHDPKASAAVSVSPSPLARGTDDALIAGYFQIDANGSATTPTINDEVPELSEPERLAENRAFRDQVTHDLVADLRPPPAPVAAAVLVAEVAEVAKKPKAATEVIEVDPSTYAQNYSSNAIYWQQHDNNNNNNNNNIGRPQLETTREAAPPPPSPSPSPPQKPIVKPTPAPQPIMISISPLAWETKSFRGAPALLAVRQVQTPDGNFAQGFVVDRSTITTQLATKAGDMVAELHAGASPAALSHAAVEVAPGWSLTVLPNPRTITHALQEAESIARAFVTRFVIVGLVALFVAACILYLVMRAEQLARERSQFAAAAAHELRTPLAGLQLYGDMLADGLGDQAKSRDYARRMSEEASRLGRVVSNVLGFSQLERGNLTVNAQVGDVSVALAELAERVQPTLDRAGAALELDVAPDLRAKFDRDALARIVGNLLDNAEKYARDAEDRTIRIAAIDQGNTVDITVSDHGPGIAAKTRLFQPFSRGVAADGPAGLGLGLALSQSLARAMGGELRYATANDGGAEFTLRLPRA